MGESMIFTFYYRLHTGAKGHVKFKCVSYADALCHWHSFVLDRDLDVIDFDHESEAICT